MNYRVFGVKKIDAKNGKLSRPALRATFPPNTN